MKTKRPLVEARRVADALIAELAPLCERIEVAGSIRRGKAEVGDIELMAIPQPVTDLFGEPLERTEVDWWLDDQVPQGDISKNGPKYKQFMWLDFQVDLFLADPRNWGLIFMLRTGPVEFSHAMVTLRTWGGYKPADIMVDGGRVLRRNVTVAVPEERDLFALWGLDYIEPEERDGIMEDTVAFRAAFRAAQS